MKILFVNPNSKFLINDKVFPNLGLMYLSAYLKENGYNNVKCIDLNGGNILPETVNADIVGLYSTTPHFLQTLRLVKKLKKNNRIRDALYVIGGPHVSGKPQDAIGDFDIVVIGEGERALLDIVRRKEINDSFKEKVVRYAYEKDIDKFPFPDRELIDIKNYKFLIDSKLTTTLITSRGCPYGCKFCANNVWGKILRMRSPQNIFEEVRMLKNRYNYESFMFFDDTMTVDRKRMQKICKLLKSLTIIYRCFIRSDTVDAKMLKLMRESGCVEVGMGIESGSQRILDIVNKGIRVKENMRVIKWCKDIGIRVKGFIIIGLPGENRETIKETIDFLTWANLDDIDVTIYIPYPGSLIYKEKEEFDIRFKDNYGHAWFKGKPGLYKSLISTSAFKSEEIVKIRDEIEKRFKKEWPPG